MSVARIQGSNNHAVPHTSLQFVARRCSPMRCTFCFIIGAMGREGRMITGSRLAARFASLRIREPGSFWRLTGVLFLVYLSTGLWSPLFSVYIKSMGAGTRDIGLVLATFQAASL